MNKLLKLSLSAMLAFALIFSVSAFPSSAITYSNRREQIEPNYVESPDNRVYLSAKKITNKNALSYSKATLLLNGKNLSSDSRIINGTAYVAVRSFINEITDMTVTYYSKTKTLKITGSGLDMEIIDGSNVIYANGRTIYNITPSVIMTNGRMYSPIESLAKVLSLVRSESGTRVALSGTPKALKSGSLFYDADAVYWLSRIISAESKGESLLGQIAVGDIVLNRVKSNQYPNTIWGVIFDRKYGVQFSPIINGTIYNAPTSTAVTAAKICLEGYTVSDEALFFLHPALSTSSWIPKNRDYLFSIGNHDFYS